MRAMLRSSSYTNLKIEEKSRQQPEFKLSEIRKKNLIQSLQIGKNTKIIAEIFFKMYKEKSITSRVNFLKRSKMTNF